MYFSCWAFKKTVLYAHAGLCNSIFETRARAVCAQVRRATVNYRTLPKKIVYRNPAASLFGESRRLIVQCCKCTRALGSAHEINNLPTCFIPIVFVCAKRYLLANIDCSRIQFYLEILSLRYSIRGLCIGFSWLSLRTV